jgi:arylsulfatase
VIDVLPTLLEVVGIREPVEVNGYIQRPIEGVSFAYSFTGADRKSTHDKQYFEMMGNRAMYHDGWIACCRHGRLPWETAGTYSYDDDRWELYNIAEDYSESVDLAEREPAKLAELQDMFLAEAAKYNVLPIDDRFAERLDVTLRPGFFTGRKEVTFYPGMTRLPEGSAPKMVGVPHRITVPVEVPDGGAEGVLAALGGDAAGFALFLWEGKVRYHYNFFGLERYDAIAENVLAPGKHTIVVDFVPDADRPGSPASVTVAVDGDQVAQARIDRQVPQRCGTECFDVGMDCVSPVCDEYAGKAPFPFTGTIESVTFNFGAFDEPTGMDRLELATKMD